MKCPSCGGDYFAGDVQGAPCARCVRASKGTKALGCALFSLVALALGVLLVRWLTGGAP